MVADARTPQRAQRLHRMWSFLQTSGGKTLLTLVGIVLAIVGIVVTIVVRDSGPAASGPGPSPSASPARSASPSPAASPAPGDLLTPVVSVADAHGAGKVATSVAFGPDGTVLATGGQDGKVRLWDAATGAARGELVGHQRPVTALAFNRVSKVLASGGKDGAIRLWDVTTKGQLAVIPTRVGDITALAFSPNGASLAVTGTGGAAQVFDATTHRVTRTFTLPGESVESVSFSPDSALIAIGSGNGGERPESNVTRLWNAATGTQIATLRGHREWVIGIAFGADGTVLTAGRDSAVLRFRTSDGAAVEPSITDILAQSVTTIEVSDDRILLGVGEGWQLSVRDFATGDLIAMTPTLGSEIEDIAFSPDRHTVAAITTNGLLQTFGLP